MLGRMPTAGDDFPFLTAHFESIAVNKAAVGIRQRHDTFSKPAELFLVLVELGLVPAGTQIEVQASLWRTAPGVRYQHPARCIFQTSHPQLSAPFVTEPSSRSDMIGVHVGDDNPLERLLLTDPISQQLSPDVTRLVIRNPGVNNSPAIAIVDQPDIDEFEREMQRTGRALSP